MPDEDTERLYMRVTCIEVALATYFGLVPCPSCGTWNKRAELGRCPGCRAMRATASERDGGVKKAPSV